MAAAPLTFTHIQPIVKRKAAEPQGDVDESTRQFLQAVGGKKTESERAAKRIPEVVTFRDPGAGEHSSTPAVGRKKFMVCVQACLRFTVYHCMSNVLPVGQDHRRPQEL